MENPAQITVVPASPTEGQIPLWDERSRGLPVTFARSALFSVGGKSERRVLNKHTIASGPGAKLVYTGEELRTDDEDVLIQLFHLARGSNVHPTEGMQNGSLSSTRLVKRRRIVYSGQILRKFVLDDGATRQQWCVWLEPEICRLFDPDYALLSWSDRMKLRRPTSRWLHTFMATVPPEELFVAPESAVYSLSGSGASTMPKFRQLLKDALREMQTEGLIYDWKLADGFLYIARNASHDINRAGHAAALAYSRQLDVDEADADED